MQSGNESRQENQEGLLGRTKGEKRLGGTVNLLGVQRSPELLGWDVRGDPSFLGDNW